MKIISFLTPCRMAIFSAIFSVIFSLTYSVSLYAADPYTLVWTVPGGNYNGSVPLGNGEVGVNAWFDAAGNLHFFLSRTDAWDEHGRLLKIGEMAVHFPRSEEEEAEDSKNIMTEFRQSLRTRDGVLEAEYRMGARQRKIRLWVDAFRPVVVMQFASNFSENPRVSVHVWRKSVREKILSETSDLPYRKSVTLQPDVLLEPEQCGMNAIGWMHINGETTTAYDETAKTQGVEEFSRQNPLAGRIFGVIASSSGAQRYDDAETPELWLKNGGSGMKSGAKYEYGMEICGKNGTQQTLEIAVNTLHPTLPEKWLAETRNGIADAQKIPVEERFQKTKTWWNQFQDRSWILISDSEKKEVKTEGESAVSPSAEETSDAFILTRAYILQRYVNACGGRGNYAIKFNGSIFTVPKEIPGKKTEDAENTENIEETENVKGAEGDYADYRRWGPGYWWQNTRLPYYSMNASGDFDLQQALFRQYREMLPLCKYRTEKYLHCEGAYYPECVYFWGDVFPETYGLQPWNERGAVPLQASGWHKREWVGGLELAFMALNYCEYTQDEAFLNETAIPLVDAVTRFFSEYYETDKETGKLVMTPSQSLETWWECTNPMPEIAGLLAVLGKLLALDVKRISPTQRSEWEKRLSEVPELPVWTDSEGVRRYAPAEKFERKSNCENPELYCVFPFRLAAFEKSEETVLLAKNALEKRLDRGCGGWRQEDLFMTYLGLTEDARKFLIQRARNSAKEQRFPGFWGPNYDWTPDQGHGGVLLAGVQSMILQTDGRKIFLMPAFPEDWNVDFRLHAPFQTTITGKYRGGEFVELNVEPESRRKDVLLPPFHSEADSH